MTHACRLFFAVFFFLINALPMFAHYNWVYLQPPSITIGQTVMVLLASGHHFPNSDMAMAQEHTRAFAESPSGKKIPLILKSSEKSLQGEFIVTESGTYIFYFETNPGVLSKTTKGWVSGGRASHPRALKSIKFYTSSLAYASTENSQKKRVAPMGLTFELTAGFDGNQVILGVFQDSTPVEGAAIALLTPGAHAQTIGKTDASGELIYTVNQDSVGDFLFITTLRKKMPEESNYQKEILKSSLVLYFK